jgi:hypothetical protein
MQDPAPPRRPHARPRHRIVYLVVAVATVIAGLIAPATAHAAPSGARGSAFVWANQPSSPSYTPSATYQWNSRHTFAAVNTVTRSGVGRYTVRLPDLAAASGTVHVTAYGASTHHCKVANWFPSGTAQLINVRCFTRTGALVDTFYTLSYTNPGGFPWDLGYVWANQPTSGSYVPSPSYQANSSGATNRIDRLGVGAYRVRLPNLGRAAGHVQVTAYGTGPERCKVGSWGPVGAEQNIRVRCYGLTGSPVDTRFTLTYVRNGNILGASPLCCHPDGHPTAYAWANQPTAASYTPAPAYQFADFGQSTISRLGVGSYAVHPPRSLSNGNVQITAYGDGSAQCKVSSWTSASGIRVLCFTTAGRPVDTFYDVSFVGPFIIG